MADLALIYKGWKSWVGQRVYVKKSLSGTLKYFGEINFKDGLWCGVELDEPVGDNDGMINNIKYFKCKAGYGIFVSLSETVRLKSTSSEVNNVFDLKKLKAAGCGEHLISVDEFSSTFTQSKNSVKFEMSNETKSQKSSDLNKTFYKNELKHIPDTFCFKVPKEKVYTDYVVDKKCKNVSKKSKNACGRLDTEESLGIISDLLDEEESWNLLDQSTANGIGKKCSIKKSSNEIDNDSVFYLPAESSYLSSKSNLCTEQVDSSIQNCSNSKFTSTPKRCLSNVFDFTRTMKLTGNQSCDFLLDEPIVAGSSKLNFETAFDFEKFQQSDILCSTLKCSMSSLPIQYHVSNEMSYVNNDELVNSNKNFNYQEVKNPSEEKCIASNVSVNLKPFANIHKEYIAENSDVLNTTFVVNPDALASPVRTSLVSHAILKSDNLHSDRKSNGVIQINSSFTTHDNFNENVSEGEKTFIIDCSPIKIPNDLSLECETVSKKKTLSTILEKTYTDVNDATKSEDKANNITEKELLISPKLSSEDTDQVIKSSSKITSSDLNSTFCISSNESKIKKNTALLDVRKRYSLSSISMKNSVYIKKEKSVITSLKANGQKSTQSRLSVFTKKKSLQRSNSTDSPSSLKQFKDIKSRDKITTGIFSASKFLEMIPNRKLKKTCSTLVESTSDVTKAREQIKKTNSAFVESNSDIAYAREQLKESLGSCKNVKNFDVEKESLPIVKIKSNSKVAEICKSVSNLPTKGIPKMALARKKISSESEKSCEFKSKNPIDVKLDVFKHRHSMLPTDLVNSENSKNRMDVKPGDVKHRHSMVPTVLRNSTRRKNSISKNESNVKCPINAVKPSFGFTESKSVPPSKLRQDDFGYKRGSESEHMEKKSVSTEKVLESNPIIKCAKKNENSTILKSKLLKPGTLSCMPVPDKISKPGCILNNIDPQSQLGIKSGNNTDNQRIYKRLPLQKLQVKY